MQATCTAENEPGLFNALVRTTITPLFVTESPMFVSATERSMVKFTDDGAETDLLQAARQPVQIDAMERPMFEINSLRSIN